MSLRIDLDARVQTRDGEDAGTVERAIFDPQGNRVQEVVVDTGGFLGRPVLVPAAEIEAAAREGDVLRLRLSKDELERLPTYVSERYAVPPTGWLPPLGAPYPGGAYLWPVSYVDPTAAPATSPTTSPTATTARDQSTSADTHPDEVALIDDATVLDRDGNDVGVVDAVRIDPATGRTMGFALRVGGLLRTLLGGGERLEVTRSQIDRVEAGTVHLRITKEELHQLARR